MGPSHDDRLTEQFERNRPRLTALARRMLGSTSEADDVVQDAWLRLDRSDGESVDNLGGWLTTVVSRLCLDRLRSRTARREEPLPAPPGPHAPVGGDDPADEVMVADSVAAALMLVLDSLAPAERVAFVLHDVFAIPFEEVATVVDRTPDAARQLASRARRRVRGASSTGDLDPGRQREVVDAFLRAARHGDLAALLAVLDPDVVLRPDAAALQLGSLTEMRGATAVAERMAGGARNARRAVVDGLAALVWAPGGTVRGVVQFTLRDGRIVAMEVTGDPERIGRLDVVVLEG